MLLKRIINNKIRSMVTQQCKNNNLGINYMIINDIWKFSPYLVFEKFKEKYKKKIEEK